MRKTELQQITSQPNQVDGVDQRRITTLLSRRTIVTTLALSPFMARAQTPCPPGALVVDGSAPPAAPACGAGATTLRDASNTGIAGAGISESSLTTQNGLTLNSTYNGQTISGRRFTGRVTLNGSNITIKGCLFDVPPGSNQYGLDVTGGAGNVIEDCTIRLQGGSGSMYFCIFVGGGSSLTVRRCNASGGENIFTTQGSNINGVLVEDCYFHGVSNDSNPGGHMDCVEVYAGSNITFRRSTLLMNTDATSTINVAPWLSGVPVDGLLVEDCYLDGGGSGTVLRDLQNNSYVRNMRIRNNYFGGHTKGSWYQFWNLNNYDAPGIASDEAALTANPNRILWTGNTYLHTRNSPFGYYNHATSRDGQAVQAGIG